MQELIDMSKQLKFGRISPAEYRARFTTWMFTADVDDLWVFAMRLADTLPDGEG